MSAELVHKWAREVPELDQGAMAAARSRQDGLTKPPGSLGRLEEISVQLAGIQAMAMPRVTGKAVVVMAGDHGVAAEGVSAYPQAVTRQMVLNFLCGGAAINVLARHAGARVRIVDMGVAGSLTQHDALTRVHIADGTANMSLGPAMSREQALQAMAEGGRIAIGLADEGVNLMACGDMGIANTTASAAIVAAVTGRGPQEVVGPGTGVTGATHTHKVNVVCRALEVNEPDPRDPVDVLAKVGGFEIAGLAGVMLAAAARRCAVVVDGLISTAAALIAVGLQRRTREYMFAGHRSPEPGHGVALAFLGLDPLLDLGMRLGEGTGAVLAMSVIEAAVKIMGQMATFEEAGVSREAGDVPCAV